MKKRVAKMIRQISKYVPASERALKDQYKRTPWHVRQKLKKLIEQDLETFKARGKYRETRA